MKRSIENDNAIICSVEFFSIIKYPQLLKPFSHIAERRVLVYLLSVFSLVLGDIDGLMTDAFGI